MNVRKGITYLVLLWIGNQRLTTGYGLDTIVSINLAQPMEMSDEYPLADPCIVILLRQTMDIEHGIGINGSHFPEVTEHRR